MTSCRNCGNQILPGRGFCSQCGGRQPVSSEVPSIALPSTRAADTTPTTSQSAVQQPPPGLFDALRDPVLRPRVVKAIGVGLAKSLGLSAAVFIPGIILSTVSSFVGIVWLFVGSFLLMLRTYSKPWRLMWVTCLTPALTSGLCFLIQLFIFRDRIPPFWLLLPCVAVGVGFGWLRAGAHTISAENGSVIAKRTAGYLIVWAVCYGITQLLGMSAQTIPLVKGSLLTSALSTSMLVCVSIMILSRFLKLHSSQREGFE